MLAASAQGMAGGGYVFIFLNNEVPTEQLFDEVMHRSFWELGDGRDKAAEKAYENLLFVSSNEAESACWLQICAACLTVMSASLILKGVIVK